MTRRKSRPHRKHKSQTRITPVSTSQELQSSNPSSDDIDTKQGFLSYLSASKGLLASSLGYLTAISQIVPTSAQSIFYCMGKSAAATFSNTCYLFYEMGVAEVYEGGYSGPCEFDAQTKYIFKKLGEKLAAQACGNVTTGCNTSGEDPFRTLEDIYIARGFQQLPQVEFETCFQDLIVELSKQYDDGIARTWIIIGLVTLSIAGACALGFGLNYARKQLSACWEQRGHNQQRDQATQGASEDTALLQRL